MKKGMIFDLYQEGKAAIRVMAINENDVIDLKKLNIIRNIDFKNEADNVVIQDIFDYEKYINS